MNPTRRGLLLGFASLLAAPAIIRVATLMPVKASPPAFIREFAVEEFDFSRKVGVAVRLRNAAGQTFSHAMRFRRSAFLGCLREPENNAEWMALAKPYLDDWERGLPQWVRA